MSLSIERLKELAQLLLLCIHRCFCACDDSVKLSSFLSLLSLSYLLFTYIYTMSNDDDVNVVKMYTQCALK